MRVGIGYDIHRLVEGRPLFLGGIKIQYNKGLLGHSDGDVLLHAIVDSLLGAVAAGDIGQHFPDTDPQYEGISSLVLLERVANVLVQKGFGIVNVDATVIAEKPKLSEFIPAMNRKIAETLKIEPDHINVKTTTNEGLGEIGKGEAIAVFAVCLVDYQ